MFNVSVIITCHQKYLEFLPNAIDSVNRQKFSFIDKIIVCDNMTNVPDFKGWQIIHGKWNNPNPARNAGLYATEADWVVFLDADDILNDNYIQELEKITPEQNTACIYPKLQYFNNETQKNTILFDPPEWDYWELRQKNYIDTSSAWNRKALLSIGGWNNPNANLDDYWLIIQLSKLCWQAKKSNGVVLKRQYSDNSGRCNEAITSKKIQDSLWNIRSFAIVSLLAGREHLFDEWANWIQNAILPPHTSLYIIDNSKNSSFYNKIIALDYSKYQAVSISKVNTQYKQDQNYNYFQKERHIHVSNLYNDILPLVNEDFILTLEDDVVPSLDGFKKLANYINLPTKIGAIGGVYPSPLDDEFVTASLSEQEWDMDIYLEQIDKIPIKIGFIGGGFTLWSNFLIKKLLPTKVIITEHGLKGWDNNLSKEIRENGYKIYLHGDVICEHRCKNE